MSPNGTVAFLLLVIIALFLPSYNFVPTWAGLLLAVFVLSLGMNVAWIAVRRAVVLSAPLGLFLLLVWVIVVGVPPNSALFIRKGIQFSSSEYVFGVTSRVFLLVLAVSACAEFFSRRGVLSFVRALWVPARLKLLLLMTISLKNTISIAANRTFTALVAAGILTPRLSARNLFGFWRLIQAVWIATLGIALERLDTKWKYERLPSHSTFVAAQKVTQLNGQDGVWIACAFASIVLTLHPVLGG